MELYLCAYRHNASQRRDIHVHLIQAMSLELAKTRLFTGVHLALLPESRISHWETSVRPFSTLAIDTEYFFRHMFRPIELTGPDQQICTVYKRRYPCCFAPYNFSYAGHLGIVFGETIEEAITNAHQCGLTRLYDGGIVNGEIIPLTAEQVRHIHVWGKNQRERQPLLSFSL